MNHAIQHLQETLKRLQDDYLTKERHIAEHRAHVAMIERDMADKSRIMGDLEAALRSLGGDVPPMPKQPNSAFITSGNIVPSSFKRDDSLRGLLAEGSGGRPALISNEIAESAINPWANAPKHLR